MNKINIALITDVGYIEPTRVVVQSLIHIHKSSREIEVRIVAVGLSAEMVHSLESLSTRVIAVKVLSVELGMLSGLHHQGVGSVCAATESALLKFRLASLLPDWSRVLYLDGDVLIQQPLDELYDTNLESVYAAVVPESGVIYCPHRMARRVHRYFNSGVMLLDLAAFRQNNLESRLIETKKNWDDHCLVDQNVFNIVLDGYVNYLPIRWNFLPVNLTRAEGRWSLSAINQLFDTHYKSMRDLYADAAIIHYSSREKPWRNSDVALAAEWLVYQVQENAQAFSPIVSVVIPCYNIERFINETLSSLVNQTLKDVEIICVDDGSTDSTLSILLAWAKAHTQIRIIKGEHKRQGFARNKGLQMARGRYVYFMDGDDILDVCALDRLVKQCESQSLDLLLFEGDSFFESKELSEKYTKFRTAYQHRFAHPCVYRGDELYGRLRACGDFIVSPCLMLIRRDVLIQKGVLFPENMPMLEDNLFAVRVFLASSRVAISLKVLFHRRVRENSTMTCLNREEAQGASLKILTQALLELADKHIENNPLRYVLLRHALATMQSYESLSGPIKKINLDDSAFIKRISKATQEIKRGWKGPSFAPCLEGEKMLSKGLFARAIQCYRDNGFVFTLRRIFFGRQW